MQVGRIHQTALKMSTNAPYLHHRAKTKAPARTLLEDSTVPALPNGPGQV